MAGELCDLPPGAVMGGEFLEVSLAEAEEAAEEARALAAMSEELREEFEDCNKIRARIPGRGGPLTAQAFLQAKAMQRETPANAAVLGPSRRSRRRRWGAR